MLLSPHLPSRTDNGSLATLLHLALILVYASVLAIKTCNLSSDACKSYGFGDSAEGVYVRRFCILDRWLSNLPSRPIRCFHLPHHFQSLHARLPARPGSGCPRLSRPPTEHAAPAPPPWWALRGSATHNREGIQALAWAGAVAVLSPLPLA
eukprot:5618213-Prymnesium_polylepis.1